MILPDDERCIQVMEALLNEPHLSAWEHDFVSSNLDRTEFSDRQKEVIQRLIEEYEV